MRKTSLVAAVFGRVVVGEQEFQGRVAPFASAVNVESYAVMSCEQMRENGSSACNGQCAEVWCDSTLETRQTVRVGDQCTNCGLGDVALSGDVYQQLSGANAYWIPVRWRCVDCGLSVEVQRVGEVICPGSGSRVDITPIEVGEGAISVENTINETRKVAASRGDSSFSDLDPTPSTDTDTSGSLAAVIKFPSLDNSSSSDNIIDAKSWHGQGEKTASAIPTFPRVPSAISSFSSPSPVNCDSFSPTPAPATIVTPASPSNEGSWSAPPSSTPSSGGIAPSVSSPASIGPANGDSSYPVGTAATSDENRPDKAGLNTTASTSHGVSGSTPTTETPDKNLSPASTALPAQSPGSIDGNLSATSAVTRSPFFYASLVLGVVGLIGIIVAYRAKRKRNHRSEMRSLQVSMRQSTRTPTPTTSLRCPNRSRLDSHDIHVVLL